MAFTNDGIHFTNPITGDNIAYTITENSLTVEQKSVSQSEWAVILAPCPLAVYQAKYNNSMDLIRLSPEVYSLTVPGCLKVETLTTGIKVTSIDSFLDSPAYVSADEDPNKEYPAGHYLPAGYSRIAYQIDQTGSITINFSK